MFGIWGLSESAREFVLGGVHSLKGVEPFGYLYHHLRAIQNDQLKNWAPADLLDFESQPIVA